MSRESTFHSHSYYNLSQIPFQAVNDCVPEKLPRLLESAATEPGTDVAVFNLDSTFDNILEKVTTENFQLRSERAERAMHVEPITEEKMYNVADKILLKVCGT